MHLFLFLIDHDVIKLWETQLHHRQIVKLFPLDASFRKTLPFPGTTPRAPAPPLFEDSATVAPTRPASAQTPSWTAALPRSRERPRLLALRPRATQAAETPAAPAASASTPLSCSPRSPLAAAGTPHCGLQAALGREPLPSRLLPAQQLPPPRLRRPVEGRGPLRLPALRAPPDAAVAAAARPPAAGACAGRRRRARHIAALRRREHHTRRVQGQEGAVIPSDSAVAGTVVHSTVVMGRKRRSSKMSRNIPSLLAQRRMIQYVVLVHFTSVFASTHPSPLVSTKKP